MRQRKVKNEEERIAEHHRHLAMNIAQYKGKWQSLFGNQNDLYVEIGCGKGQFILTLAEQNPDRNYIGIEGRGSIILRALEKASKKDLRNLVFVQEYIKDIEEYFEQDELSGIYLNFSDPWPKDRHAKRRLTHSRYLEAYQKVLKPGHGIEFKTDNDLLFEFALNEFLKNGMQVAECTRDLHHGQLSAKAVTTEYEDKFRAVGKNINYCKVLNVRNAAWGK